MTTTAIAAQVEDYLVSRRAMGFDLLGEGYQLHAFARFANEQSDAGALTLELLLRWVQGAARPGPVTAARRVEVLRPFLKYCRQFDPVCPVVPLGLCGRGHRRLSPHIYTEAEVTALLVAARELKPDGLRPLTYVTLFGLLAATGMRLSEALRLERKDLNLDQPSLTVRETKFINFGQHQADGRVHIFGDRRRTDSRQHGEGPGGLPEGHSCYAASPRG